MLITTNVNALEKCATTNKLSHHNCFASHTWSNGERYAGEWQHGSMHGYGTFYYADKSIRSGYWQFGKWSLSPTETQIFSQCKNGTYHNCHGSYTFDNLDVYTGKFVYGRGHGRGKKVWNNGKSYVGDFVEGKMQGKGIYTWPNGDVCLGSWLQDRSIGSGVFVTANGEEYSRECDSNLPINEAPIEEPKSQKFTDGPLFFPLLFVVFVIVISTLFTANEDKKSIKKHKIIKPEAIEPEAIEPEAIEPEAIEPEAIEPEAIELEEIKRSTNRESSQDSPAQKKVTKKYTDGTGIIYEGGWVDGLKHGKGTVTYENGDKYEGEWIRGKKQGKGKWIFAEESSS